MKYIICVLITIMSINTARGHTYQPEFVYTQVYQVIYIHKQATLLCGQLYTEELARIPKTSISFNINVDAKKQWEIYVDNAITSLFKNVLIGKLRDNEPIRTRKEMACGILSITVNEVLMHKNAYVNLYKLSRIQQETK